MTDDSLEKKATEGILRRDFAFFEDKNMYFECVGVVTSDVRRRSLHLGDHRLGARHGHRDRQDHQGLDHRRYSWLRRRGSDDR